MYNARIFLTDTRKRLQACRDLPDFSEESRITTAGTLTGGRVDGRTDRGAHRYVRCACKTSITRMLLLLKGNEGLFLEAFSQLFPQGKKSAVSRDKLSCLCQVELQVNRYESTGAHGQARYDESLNWRCLRSSSLNKIGADRFSCSEWAFWKQKLPKRLHTLKK